MKKLIALIAIAFLAVTTDIHAQYNAYGYVDIDTTSHGDSVLQLTYHGADSGSDHKRIPLKRIRISYFTHVDSLKTSEQKLLWDFDTLWSLDTSNLGVHERYCNSCFPIDSIFTFSVNFPTDTCTSMKTRKHISLDTLAILTVVHHGKSDTDGLNITFSYGDGSGKNGSKDYMFNDHHWHYSIAASPEASVEPVKPFLQKRQIVYNNDGTFEFYYDGNSTHEILEVFDALGRIVYRTEVIPNQILHHKLENGTYFVKCGRSLSKVYAGMY